MEEKQDLFGKCPYFTIQKILSGKWAFMILYHLQEKTLRFNQIQKLLPEVTQTTLTKQLRTLEDYGIVKRTIYPQIPPKVEYELSDMGKEFSESLESLKLWGEMILQVQELEDIEKLSLNLLSLFSKQRRSYDRVQFK